jgi:L-aspartate oxidase
MTRDAGIVRNDKGLKKALASIQNLHDEYQALPDAPFTSYPLETDNLLIAARYVIEGALARRQNLGLHFNEDLSNANTIE